MVIVNLNTNKKEQFKQKEKNQLTYREYNRKIFVIAKTEGTHAGLYTCSVFLAYVLTYDRSVCSYTKVVVFMSTSYNCGAVTLFKKIIFEKKIRKNQF